MENLDNKTLFVLPCAGYGLRMGQPICKELMVNPKTGRPYIEFALDAIQKQKFPKAVHVIIRAEKNALIDYLKTINMELKLDINVQIIEPSQEWPDTILQSQNYWQNKNILVLPDTEFSPIETLTQINEDLTNHDLVVGVFETPDLGSFGAIAKADGNYIHAEKPLTWQDAKAWGLIGFNKTAGVELFNQMLDSTFDHKWRRVPGSVKLIDLKHFVDLTRGNYEQ